MPSFKSFIQKKQSTNKNNIKPNITTIFVETNTKNTMKTNHNEDTSSPKKLNQFTKLLENEIIDIQKLGKLAWNGIPDEYRSKVWKILLKYTSTNKDNHKLSLCNKRKDYFHLVNSYIDNPNLEFGENEKKIYKLIHDDVKRTMPESILFREAKVQQMLQRVLYVWHIRHPSSGYVQGLNDILSPFLIVFLSDYVDVDLQKVETLSDLNIIKSQDLSNIEADSYWCFTKILNEILDNYTNSWPGIQKSFLNVQQIFNRVDPGFLSHFKAKGIDFYHIYFKWVTCLLLRQFSTKICLRLFDTFLSIGVAQGSFFDFVQYIFVAVFLKYSKQIKKLNFEDLMAFQHRMPTKTWQEDDLQTIIAEAYVYQNYFSTV